MSVRTGVDEYNRPTSDINSGYIGEFKYFGFESVPPHCLACDGSEVSRETYSELFEVFGETYGAGDGSTTFNLPDFRGYFLRGAGGAAAAIGTAQGDAIREILGSMNGVFMWNEAITSGAFTNRQSSEIYKFQSGEGNTVEGHWINFAAGNSVPTAAENRPINYAVNICVVFE